MKRLLFVCHRNIVLGPMAEAVFSHMGPSLLSAWEVGALGCGQGIDITSSDVGKIQQILQKQAVPFKQKARRVLSKKDVLRSNLVICFEKRSFDMVVDLVQDGTNPSLQMLADYHPDSPIEIPDPISNSDPKSYEKCYWMVYKAVRELVKKLKEEAKPKRVRVNLQDPTIFTITSPSCWQRNKLKSPDIFSPDIFQPPHASGSVFTVWPDPKLKPPENPMETEDNHNNLPTIKKTLIEQFLDFKDVKIVIPSCHDYEKENLLNSSYSSQSKISSPGKPNSLISIFHGSPPQLAPEVPQRWPTPPPVEKGGDLFDDIKKYKAVWRR